LSPSFWQCGERATHRRSRFVSKWNATTALDGEFDRPCGIALDSNGNVYVAGSNNFRIQKFAPAFFVVSGTWHTRRTGGEFLGGVSYGNGTFVAAGDSGHILTSSDGINWTSQTSGVSADLFGIAHGNGTFVAVGSSGTIITSPNGTTWEPQVSGTTGDLNGVTYGRGTFVMVGELGAPRPPSSPLRTERHGSPGLPGHRAL
jgi:hypothetical protein